MNLLILEDYPADAELLRRALLAAFPELRVRVARDRAALVAALADPTDLILADYRVPGTGALDCLELLAARGLDIPVIVVTGTQGDEAAAECFKHGAVDYLLKDRLSRLAPAVTGALEAKRIKAALREREAGLRRAQQMAKLAHVVTGPDGSFESWSDTVPQLLGLDPGAMPRSLRDSLALVHPDDRALFRDVALEAAAARERKDLEYRIRRADGTWLHIRHIMEPFGRPNGGRRWFSTLQDVSELRRAEAALQDSDRRFRSVFENTLAGVFQTTREGRFVAANQELARIMGFRSAKELIASVTDLEAQFYVEPAERRRFLQALEAHESVQGFETRMRRRDGAVIWVALSARASRDERGELAYVVGMLQDVTRRRESEEQVRRLNRVHAEHDERVVGRERALAAGSRAMVVLPLGSNGGVAGALVLHAESAAFFDEQEMKLLNELAADISFGLDHIEKSERVEYLAYYDQSTGLANRTLFLERLKQSMLAARPAGNKVGLAIADVERLTTINESLGRQAGDAVIKELARRLTSAVEPSLLARLGADHFAIAYPGITSRLAAARAVENLLRDCTGRPFSVAGSELRVAMRSGLALFPDDGTEAEALLTNAEAALRKAKESGERHYFYTPALTQQTAERLTLENRLRLALENEEYTLYYQPKVKVETRRITGLEALIRWRSPELGLVPPAKFIPLMEETGLILEVGAWALAQAISDHSRWHEQGLRVPRVAVNVSANQLRRSDFVDTVAAALARGQTPPGIDLEITESLVMEDIESNIAKLRKLRALGLQIAVDDFGTGYSSLGYLAKLPVQELKIDRSFIASMLNDPATMSVVQTIISLAHALRLKVVAEGVDSEDQARILRLLRCDEMQGYLIGKPAPFDELSAVLGSQGDGAVGP